MSTRLRVLEISPSRQVWGAELATLQLLEPLARRGVDTVLAAPAGDFAAAWTEAGGRHVALELPERRGLRGGSDERAGARQLTGELQASAASVRRIARIAGDAEVLHTSSLWIQLDVAVAARIARRPAVIELCDLVRAGVGRHVLTASMALAAAGTAVSAAAAACVGPPGRRRLKIVAPAVDLARFAPRPADPGVRAGLAADPDAPLVGIVGRIDPAKGVDVVVRAVAALPSRLSHTQLVVVGSPGLDGGGYLADVQALAAPLGGRIRFVDRVDDVPPVMGALDVLVNASEAEPFGLTVLEAQASGVAVAAAAGGGIPDFVTDRRNGLLFPPADVAALSGVLAELLGDVELRLRLGRQARADAEAAHGIERRADTVADIFRAVAAGRRVPVDERQAPCAS